MSPTARTLDRLRKLGFTAGIVERWIAQAGIRKDFLGSIDLIACKPGEGIIGVQATALSCLAARLNKARKVPELATWLESGGRFQVWAWGFINGRWHPRIVELHAGDVVAVVQRTPRKKRKPRHVAGDLFASLS